MVSIIIPNNNDKYIEETLNSIKAQTYKNYEVIILSTREYGDIGLNKKVNLGAKKAKGEYLLVLSDDDTIEPDYLEKTVEMMKDVDIVYTDMRNFGDYNSIDIAMDWNKGNFQGSTVPYITSLVRKEMFNKVGGWEEEEYVYGDWNFWSKCFKAEATAFHLREPLFNYRRHKEQASNTTDNHPLLRANTLKLNDL